MLRWAGCLGQSPAACHLVAEHGTLERATLRREVRLRRRSRSRRPRCGRSSAGSRRAQTAGHGSGAVIMDAYGGAISRVAPGATAFVHRDALYSMQYLAYWGAPAAPARRRSRGCAACTRRCARTSPGAAYQNYIDPDLTALAAGLLRLQLRSARGREAAATTRTGCSASRRRSARVSLHDDFQRDGAVCVRGAFSADEVALVERGIERNLAEPSERALVASRPDDPGRFFEDFCNWQRIPEFERVHPRVARGRDRRRADGLADGSGSSTTTCSSRSRARASGRRGTRTSRTTTSRARRTARMWMPVDPVDRASRRVEFVAGSHRGPWLMPRTFMDERGEVVPGGQPRGAARRRGRPRRVRILALGARAGRRRVLPHAHAARRRRRDAAAARVLGALPRRRRDARAARRGRRRRSSRGSRTSCRRARRWRIIGSLADFRLT